MPHVTGALQRHRVEVGFVEADVEIGFNLVNLADQELQRGHSGLAGRVLHEIDEVLRDIDQRLSQLGDADRACFGPLVSELRREAELAKLRNSRYAE